ncbi:MAG: hypothetical protein ACOYB2_10620 [Limnohabitans sp.]
MSVGASELLFCSSSIGASAGGTCTGVPYSNAKGGFFANIADVDRLAGGTEIKKWFLKNTAPLDGLISPSVWIQQEPTFITEEIGVGWDSSDDNDPDQGNMTGWSTNVEMSLVSDGSDTRDVIVLGLDAAGNPQQETVTLTGTSHVESTTVWSVVYGWCVSATNGTRTVTAHEGVAGTVRGVIGPGSKASWLWIEALDKGSGIRLPDLPPGEAYGFWDRLTWVASVSGVRPNISVIGVEEN